MAILEAAALKSALRFFAPFAGSAALVASGFAGAEIYEHRVPWGLARQRDRVAADRDVWKKAQDDTRTLAIGWATSFGRSEGLRKAEHAGAVSAVNASAQACAARVAAARRSAAAIQTLVTKEVSHDANGCPVRRLADPRELFNALGVGPAAGR